MRQKTWSSLDAPDTLRVQAFREMPVGGEGGGEVGISGEAGTGTYGGEGGVNIGGEGSPTVSGGEGNPLFMAEVRAAGGEGGGTPG
jgi:hypothetical protein